MKPHASHIKFIDVNNANKFSMVIFVDMVVKKEESLLQDEKRLDSNSLDNIVDRKLKMHAYLFSPFDFNKKFKNICFCF